MDEILLYKRKLEREKAARLEAERLLEAKAIELFEANQKLRKMNLALEEEVSRKTKDLKAQKRYYQNLVDLAQDIIFLADSEGHFTYVNPIAEQITGIAAESLIGRHFTDLLKEEDREKIGGFYLEQIDRKESLTYLEFPMLDSRGKEIWVGQKVNLIIEDGEVREVMGIARDITEQRENQQKLSNLNSRLRTILENLTEAVLVEDQNRRIVLVNQRFCDLFEIPVPPEQLIGADCSQSAEQAKHLFADPDQFVKDIEGLLADQKLEVAELINMQDDRIVERDYIPIYREDLYAGHMWRYQDVTEKIRAERKIRESEEKYRGIIENMELGLMEVDPDGMITKPYPIFCQMTGYQQEELLGEKADDVFLTPEWKAFMERQNQKRREGQTSVYEVQIKRKDGKLVWVLISGAPFYDEKGKVAGSIGIHYDISEQKQLQKELEEARQQAEKARDAEKEFLANMSHEIRNPINSIIGLTHLLFDTASSPEQLNYLNDIKYASDILLALVSDILDISKIAEGKMEPAPRLFNLSELVIGIVKTMQFRTDEKDVTLDYRLAPNIPDQLIGDATFLNQILLNLIGNAVKFTQQGSVFLSVEGKQEGETLWTKFVVEDTGIGIPAEKKESIFERFSQAGKVTRSHYGGTGLGLPITKKLVEIQGGEIEVESEVGKGTAFTFCLPFQIPKREVSSVKEMARGRDILEQKLHVLVVEDNELNRHYLEKVLSNWGYSYSSAGHGQEALLKLSEEHFDLVLMDIRMPVMDGYEATIHLRNSTDNPNRNVPVIALTASALLDEKEKALNAGMNEHLCKPFTPDQLAQKLQDFFTERKETKEEVLPEEKHFGQPFDHALLEELYGGDKDHIQLMFELFKQNTPQELDMLEKGLEESDLIGCTSILHKIKPNFQMIGVPELSEYAGELETLLKSDKPPENWQEDCRSFIRKAQEILDQLKVFKK
jgi:PAS domain S-box-containing protein